MSSPTGTVRLKRHLPGATLVRSFVVPSLRKRRDGRTLVLTVDVAVALGARAAFVGRPYLYALMAGGEAGVDHLTRLLRDHYVRTLKLLGVASTAELSHDLVSLVGDATMTTQVRR